MMVVNGMTFGGPTVFDDLLLENLKNSSGEPISRAELKFRESIMIWSAAGFGFLSGTFADKFGVNQLCLLAYYYSHRSTLFLSMLKRLLISILYILALDLV